MIRRLTVACWLVALGGALAGGCRSAQPPAAPAPTGDTLADLEALTAVGQIAASVGRAVCGAMPPGHACSGALDALDEGLVVARAALDSARVCREAEGEEEAAECVASARATAQAHLPALQRLVRAALGAQ